MRLKKADKLEVIHKVYWSGYPGAAKKFFQLQDGYGEVGKIPEGAIHDWSAIRASSAKQVDKMYEFAQNVLSKIH